MMNMPLTQIKIYLVLFFALFIVSAGLTNVAESAPPLKLSGRVSNGTQYEAYTATLLGENGITPYIWTITAGSLPPGLSLVPLASGTADIAGIPTQDGTFPFTVTLIDSSNPSQNTSKAYSITIDPGNCTFVGSNIGGISFNVIDPSMTPGPIFGTVTQQTQFTCKAGLAYTVAANPASGWTIESGVDAIPYTLGFISGGTGLGATPIDLLTANSQILQADYANAAAGAYVNTQPVNITISWTTGGGGSIIATIPAGNASGTVINTCAVSQSAGTLTFNIDPSVSGITSASISPDMQIQCTSNSSVSVTASSACGGLDSSFPACGGSKIPYTFNYLSGITGQGFGTDISLNLGGSAASADYENAAIGNYGDLQTLTITY